MLRQKLIINIWLLHLLVFSLFTTIYDTGDFNVQEVQNQKKNGKLYEKMASSDARENLKLFKRSSQKENETFPIYLMM
jgi:hypothetical protein